MKEILSEIKMIGKGIRYIHILAPWNLLLKLGKNTINAALPFVDMYFSALIIDTLLNREGISKAVLLACLLVGINLILTLASAVMEIKNFEMFNGLYRKYNMMISDKVMRLDYAKIEDPETHKTVRNIDNAMKISNYGLIKIHSGIPLLYQNLLSMILSVVFIVQIIAKPAALGSRHAAVANSSALAALLIFVLCLTACTSIIGNEKIAAKTYSLLGVFSKINCVYDYYLTQYLAGHKAGKDIRLYEQYHLIADELSETGKRSCGIVKEINATDFKYRSCSDLAHFLLNILSCFYVGIKAVAGAISIGDVTKFSGAVAQFGSSVYGTVDAVSQLRSNTPYLREFLQFMEQESDMYQGSLTVEKRDDNEYEIEFRDVSFRYPNTAGWALHHVDLKFNVREKLAVVGMNGSGKTTFIKLLCRLYDPTEGEILLNGVNIKKYDYDEYQSVFSVVFQDFRLFSFSLGQNVAARAEYDRNRAERCLKKAGFGERFCAMPDGLDTYLYKDFDDAGVEISGGEAQKIALARALYKEAPFIILDEPTAALDPVAEYEIYSKFNDISGDKTAVYISHRLAACRCCDKIAVFHEGAVIQQGIHAELLADEAGKYHELWYAQAQYYMQVNR